MPYLYFYMAEGRLLFDNFEEAIDEYTKVLAKYR